MNYLQRIYKSIVRQPMKSFILLLVIFIFGNLVVGALVVKQAVVQTQTQIIQDINPVVTVGPDLTKVNSQSYSDKILAGELSFYDIFLNEAEIQQLGNSETVKYFDYSLSAQLLSDTLQTYGAFDDQTVESGYVNIPRHKSFYLQGVNYPQVIAFDEGKGKLIAGRTFTEEEKLHGSNVVIVTKSVAELNGITIGDSIEMRNVAFTNKVAAGQLPQELGSENVELRVIGIYDTNQEITYNSDGSLTYNVVDQENTFYVLNTYIHKLRKFTSQFETETEAADSEEKPAPIFVLNKMEDFEQFQMDAEPYMSAYGKMIVNTDYFDVVSGPLDTLVWLADWVLVIAIGATILVVSLLVMLYLRERRIEMGIYLSLGEQPHRIVKQIIGEMLIVTLVAVTCALFSGVFIAQEISQGVLQNQLLALQEDQFDEEVQVQDMGYTQYQIKDEVERAYEVKVTTNIVVMFYVMSIVVICCAAGGPIVYILRLNPKKIMF